MSRGCCHYRSTNFFPLTWYMALLNENYNSPFFSWHVYTCLLRNWKALDTLTLTCIIGIDNTIKLSSFHHFTMLPVCFSRIGHNILNQGAHEQLSVKNREPSDVVPGEFIFKETPQFGKAAEYQSAAISAVWRAQVFNNSMQGLGNLISPVERDSEGGLMRVRGGVADSESVQRVNYTRTQ